MRTVLVIIIMFSYININSKPISNSNMKLNDNTSLNLKIGIIQINVTDLSKAKEFYGKTLNIPIKETLGKDAPFELLLGNSATVLVYQVEKATKIDYPKQSGISLVFYTDDLDKTVAEWKEKKVEFIKIEWSKDSSGIAECPFGKFIAFKDPFGNVHELLQPKKTK